MSLSLRSVVHLDNALLFRNALVMVQHRRGQPPFALSCCTFATKRRRMPRNRGRHRTGAPKSDEMNKQARTTASEKIKTTNQKPFRSAASTTTQTSARNTTTSATSLVYSYLVPVRYRTTGRTYTKEQAILLAQRLPLWLLLATLFWWEETSPYSFVTIYGPSMLPTMAPDRSEIWLRSTFTWRRKLGRLLPWSSLQPSAYYKVGDLVAFAHPDFPGHVSCKRIVGMPGDTVKRYGQYVHLYVHQDPVEFGRIWPDDEAHSWIERDWDRQDRLPNRRQEARRTIVVPPGHVWVEADCPGLGIDSRHFGPIPVEWLRGKIKGRVWPLWRSREEAESHPSYKKRPHPIPLDKETLRQYNVHTVSDA